LLPSDLAYVEIPTYDLTILGLRQMSLVHHDGQGPMGGDILELWGSTQLPPYRSRTHFTRMAHTLRPWPYTSCANSVEQCCTRVWGEGDHHIHNVNDFNTLLDILCLGVINFVGLLFLGNETISIRNCGANECHCVWMLCLDV
jgi:hypothetical protein